MEEFKIASIAGGWHIYSVVADGHFLAIITAKTAAQALKLAINDLGVGFVDGIESWFVAAWDTDRAEKETLGLLTSEGVEIQAPLLEYAAEVMDTNNPGPMFLARGEVGDEVQGLEA